MGLARRTITIAGAGPGSVDYLTPAARRAIEGAELLVGAPRLLEVFAVFATPQAAPVVVGSDIESVLAAIAAAADRNVVVLVTGDPGVLSLARPIVARFGRDACHFIAGISSVQVAFARQALEWADARVVDAHGGVPDLDPLQARSLPKVAVLVGCAAAAPWLSALGRALADSHRVVVCQDLTLPSEQVGPWSSDTGPLATFSRTIVLFLHKELLP
jgi:precorrin-6y C5,15-methyltransferase (decarboxylating) CbiE subunit